MAMKPIFRLFCGLAVVASLATAAGTGGYYGTKIGPLTELHHGVSGDVYAIDSRTILLKNFNYDGEGPAAYFYVGNGSRISNKGATRLRDERGQAGVIHRYRNTDVMLQLPEGKTLRDIKWFAIWCDEFSVNFGDVKIPKNFQFPKPQKIDALSGVHGVASDNIVIVDAQTLLVPYFSYDGEAPDAKFWVGYGQKPTPNGLRIPDENGREQPLLRYDNKTIVLTLPGDLTVFEIGHFGVWCEAFTVDFGHVRIPQSLNVPPSLRMLGISPESKLNCEVLNAEKSFEVRWAIAGDSIVVQLLAKLDNNEYMSFGLSPNRQKSAMIGADVAVAHLDRATGKGTVTDYHLADKSQCSGKRGSCPDTRLEASTDSVRLLNAALVNDFSIVTYQRPLRASDAYDLEIVRNESQAIVWGIGPLNERLEVSFHTHFNRKTESINFGRKPVWNCQLPDGNVSMRPGGDDEDEDADEEEGDEDAAADRRHEDDLDDGPPVYQQPQRPQQQQRPSIDNRRQEIATRRQPGPVETVHIDDRQQHRNRGGQAPQLQQQQPLQPQHFMSNRNDQQAVVAAPIRRHPPQQQSVPTPRPASRAGAWEIPPIQCYEPEDGVFYAQMGPTGGKQGYPAITGHVGWGISWYINGLLIPEINVVRGKTYTFVVESGNDPEVAAKYHPFYITDDPIGGYEYKTDEEKQAVRIFAGVHRSRSGQVAPIGTGRLCNWTPDLDGPPADEYTSFGAYQRSLTLKCDEGEAGIIVWRPDEHTPDTVYYQCFTHRHLGWRINVHDHCEEGAASEVDEVYASAGPQQQQQQQVSSNGDALLQEASVRHETKVRPNEIFLLQHEKDLIKNHNMNELPPKVKFDVNKNLEISKLITEGIRAAEALEESIARPTKHNRTVLQQQQQQLPHNNGERIEFQVINSEQPHNKPPAKPEIPQYVSDTSVLSEYLRPPGVQNGPLFRPLKVAGRPRPPPPSAEQRRPGKPPGPYRHQTALPQPSIIVNHYKKPVSPLIRPFVKQQKPIQSLASVLLLGQPTELPLRKTYDPKVYSEHGSVHQLPPNKPPKSVLLPFNKGVSHKGVGGPAYHRESYAPKFTYASLNGGGPPKPHAEPILAQPSYNVGAVLRKKPQHGPREPHLPLKGTKGAFKSPYEISGPKAINDVQVAASNNGPHRGFQPDTLIVEGGFKPIVRRRTGNSDDGDRDTDDAEIMLTSNRRSDDNVPAVMVTDDDEGDNEQQPSSTGGEGDALFVNQDIPTALFEPMFIPSPPDSINSSSKKPPAPRIMLMQPPHSQHQHRIKEHLSGDLIDMEVEDGDDKMAMAGERVDAYYLPPDMPRTPPHSNFFPEGSVVTYDGKAVLDTSLVNSLPLNSLPPLPPFGHSGGGPLSKTEQLIRNTPQFGPFRGEIPPIGPDFGPPPELPVRFLPFEQQQLPPKTGGQTGTHPTINGGQQRPVTEYTNPLTNSTNPISTRLVLLNPLPARGKRGDEDDADALEAEEAAAQSVRVETVVADEPKRTIRLRGVVL